MGRNRPDNMAAFLIFDLRFLIADRLAIGADGQIARSERGALPNQFQGSAGASPYRISTCRYKSLIFRRLSPFCRFFHRFFTLFFRCKRLVFRRLQKIPGDKRRRGRKIKCEIGKRRGFSGETGRHELGGSEIFHREGIGMFHAKPRRTRRQAGRNKKAYTIKHGKTHYDTMAADNIFYSLKCEIGARPGCGIQRARTRTRTTTRKRD